MIPTGSLADEPATTLAGPASDSHNSSQVNISMTEEMFNPLASPAVEHAISRETAKGPSSPGLGVTRRSARMEAVPISVEDHPLETREEQTRARKLRDLQKFKRLTESGIVEQVAELEEKALTSEYMVKELTEALAKIMGIEVEEGETELDPEAVLKAFKEARLHRN